MKKNSGFTILEVLIAVAIATGFVVPISLFFYKSHANQLAYEKYLTHQLLKKEMHRVLLEPDPGKKDINIEQPRSYTVIIESAQQASETIFKGTIYRNGKPVASQIASRYAF